jgi:hypothetical protein
MVIYSPSSIKMGFGNTSAARSLRLTGTTPHAAEPLGCWSIPQ